MTGIVDAITIAAPYYNLAFVLIVLFLFGKLFATKIRNKKVFLRPWRFLFAAVLVFIVEEFITVLRAAGIVTVTKHINGFFELIIIALFIYMLLVQKEHVERK